MVELDHVSQPSVWVADDGVRTVDDGGVPVGLFGGRWGLGQDVGVVFALKQAILSAKTLGLDCERIRRGPAVGKRFREDFEERLRRAAARRRKEASPKAAAQYWFAKHCFANRVVGTH